MADEFLTNLPVLTDVSGSVFYAVKGGTDYQVGIGDIQGSTQPQAANLVYAGPVTAPGDFPEFRPLVLADIPDLSSLYLASTGGSLSSATINNSNIVGGTISGATATFDDNKLTIRDQTDTTKKVMLEVSGVTTGTTRVLSVPDETTTLVGTTTAQTLTNKVVRTTAGTTANAPVRIPHGSAPTSPVNGDMWTTTAGVYVRINNSTVGPLAAATGSTVNSFNGRVGSVTLSSADVINALGYTPANVTIAAVDANVVHITGNETVAGSKTFTSPITVTDAVAINGDNYAGLTIKGDYNNTSGEIGGAFVSVQVDGGTVEGIFGQCQTVDQAPDGTAYTGVLQNCTLVGNKYSGLQLGAAGDVKYTIGTTGLLSGTGSISVGGDITAAGTVYSGGSAVMNQSWTLTAGNGLTGGGSGAANRTVTLGTPGTLTGSTTNSVTTTSHTHAITVNLGISGTTGALTVTNSAGTNAVIPVATSLASGLVSTGNQTWGGTKTAVNFVATSDARLKKNINSLAASDRLADMLRFVEYLWKDSGERAVGVIAQEVRSVAPEYVFEDENGMLAVDKAGLALECVIGLAARVRDLENK